MSQVTTLTTEKQIEQESGVDSSMSAQHRDSKVVTPGHYNVEQDIETGTNTCV